MERIGSVPILPIKQTVTIGVMLYYDGDRDGHGDRDGTYKQAFKANLYEAKANPKTNFFIFSATQCEQQVEFPKNPSGIDVVFAFASAQCKRTLKQFFLLSLTLLNVNSKLDCASRSDVAQYKRTFTLT